MQKVPLKKLKENLAMFFEKAAKGETLQITRYNRPYVFVTGFEDPSLHVGKRVGKTNLQPAIEKALKKSSLEFLLEDRSE